MERLSQTVQKAVAKMKEKKEELRQLQKEHVRLKEEYGKVNAEYVKKMKDLQIKLTSWVDCIRQTEPTFLDRLDPYMYYTEEANIKKKLLQLESGLSNMYLFVRAKDGVEPMLRVSEDGSKIIFEDMTPNNPFDDVYQGVDRIETPWLENFLAFKPKLIQDIHENKKLFLSFYGPSGTGKTTMMRQVFRCVWDELHNKRFADNTYACNTQVKVQQLYVRSRMFKSIPDTAGSDMSEVTETGLHELFNLKKVGETDVVKVYLNNVQMIHSVGCELYKHSRKLYRLLQYLIPSNIDEVLIHEGNNYVLNKDEIIKALAIDHKIIKERAQLRENVDTWTDYVIAPLQEIIQLCNSTRAKLHRLVTERIVIEKDYYDRPTDEYFIKTGGFIPLFWIPYANPEEVERISSFRDLKECNTPHENYVHIYLQNESDIGHDVYMRYLIHIRTLFNEHVLYLEHWHNPDFEVQYYEKIKSICVAVQKNPTYDVANQVFKLVGDSRQLSYPSNKTAKDMQDDIHSFSFQRSTPQNQDSSRCATIYTFEYDCYSYADPNEKKKETITLVDLPGNEDQIVGCNTEGEDNILCMETRGIRELLRFIRHMMKIKRLKIPVEVPYPSSIFKQVFQPMMDSECKVGLLCFAANYDSSPNYPVNMRATLDFVETLTSGEFSCDKMVQKRIVEDMVLEEEAYLKKERELAEKIPKKEVADKVGEAGAVNDDEDVSDLVSILPLIPVRYDMSPLKKPDISKRLKLVMKYDVDGKDEYGSFRFNVEFTCTGHLLKAFKFFVQMIDVNDIEFKYKAYVDPKKIFFDPKTSEVLTTRVNSMRANYAKTFLWDKYALTALLKSKQQNSLTLPVVSDHDFNYTPLNATLTYSLFQKSLGAITVMTKLYTFKEYNMSVSFNYV